MKYFIVPAPVALKNIVTDESIPFIRNVDGAGREVSKEPNIPWTMHRFFLTFVGPLLKGFKEFRAGNRIMKVLNKIESDRSDANLMPFAALEDEDHALFVSRLNDVTGMNGIQGIQFLPFYEALESAKEEKPSVSNGSGKKSVPFESSVEAVERV